MHKTNNVKDYLWKKFNMLTVIGDPLKQEWYHNKRVRVRCDCWVEKDMFLSPLINLRYESCSCKQYADMRINNKTHWMSWWWKRKHSKIYSTRYNIKYRTTTKNTTIKNRWYVWVKCLRKTFDDFKNDMYESLLEHIEKYWEANTSIDRIDPYWDYSKENCRWATIEVQSYNRKESYWAEYNWIKMPIKKISEKVWIPYETMLYRYKMWLDVLSIIRQYESWKKAS